MGRTNDVAAQRRIADIARRLNAAADGEASVPDKHKGRFTAIAEQITELTGQEIRSESVRRWFTGIARPSEDNLAAVAKILRVDCEWLARGVGGDVPVFTGASKRPVPTPAAVKFDVARHLLIGIVGTSGAVIKDVPTAGVPIHVSVVVQGATYALHGVLGQRGDSDELWSFRVPSDAQETVVVGIVPVGPARYQVYALEVDWADVAGGHAVISTAKAKPIDFTRRF